MDILGVLSKFMRSGSFELHSSDPKVLALRSETIRRVDCAMTVKNTVDPLIKILRLNMFLYITVMLAFVLMGNLGLFLALLGLGVNLFYSRRQSLLILEIQDKYKIE